MLKKLWRLILRLFNFKDKGEGVPQGLEVYDENGVVTLSTNDRTTIFIDTVTLTPTKKQVILSDDIFSKNTAFFIHINNTDALTPSYAGLKLTASGSSLTVSASNVYRNSELIIGVY